MDRNPLAELAQLGLGELGIEFGLPEQEHLEQLLALGLEVREQPDLLEQVAVEVLGLVEQQDGALALGVQRQQVALEVGEDLRLAQRALDREAEPQRDLLEQLVARQRGVGDHGHHGARLPLVEDLEQRGGLAGADLAGDEHERLAVLDPVAQVGEGLLVLRARVDEPALVPGDERVLAQREMRFEHSVSFGFACDRPGRAGGGRVRSGSTVQPRSAGIRSAVVNSAVKG